MKEKIERVLKDRIEINKLTHGCCNDDYKYADADDVIRLIEEQLEEENERMDEQYKVSKKYK